MPSRAHPLPSRGYRTTPLTPVVISMVMKKLASPLLGRQTQQQRIVLHDDIGHHYLFATPLETQVLDECTQVHQALGARPAEAYWNSLQQQDRYREPERSTGLHTGVRYLQSFQAPFQHPLVMPSIHGAYLSPVAGSAKYG